jgi:hypothetical protein
MTWQSRWAFRGAQQGSGGGQGGVRGVLDLRWESWGEQGRFSKYTTRSNERVCPSSCKAVSCAVDHRCASSAACLTVSEVLVAVWVLDVALLVVSQVVAADSTGVGGCDVAVATGGSGREWRDWGLGRSAVGMGRVSASAIIDSVTIRVVPEVCLLIFCLIG